MYEQLTDACWEDILRDSVWGESAREMGRPGGWRVGGMCQPWADAFWERLVWVEGARWVQGYLVHLKTPTSLRPPHNLSIGLL